MLNYQRVLIGSIICYIAPGFLGFLGAASLGAGQIEHGKGRTSTGTVVTSAYSYLYTFKCIYPHIYLYRECVHL